MKHTPWPSLIALAACSTLCADVITVDDDGPADYPTIQAGIDAAFTGDTVLVSPGEYIEAIDFLGKEILVESVAGPLETSIKAPPGNTSPTVRFSSGEMLKSTISGFKIGGGNGGLIEDPVFGTMPAGGGIFCMDSSPTIFDCVMVGMSIEGSGGGMVIVRGDPWVVDCQFLANSAAAHGGGVYILDNANPLVTGCTFEDNVSSWGGGVTCTVSCNPTFTDCSFIGNEVYNVGGGMFVRSSSSPVITNCRFDGNIQAGNPYAGGAGFTTYGSGTGGGPCYPELVNCTFIDNSSDAFGGAVHAAYAGNVSMTGCIFTANTSSKNGGAISVIGDPGAPTTVTMEDCDLWMNVSSLAGGGLDSRGATVLVDGCLIQENVAAESGGGCHFVDSAGSEVGSTIICGNLPDQVVGDHIDMGGNVISDTCEPACSPDLNGDGIINGADLTILLASWGDCEVIEGCTGDINGDGTVDGADLTALLGDWGDCF